MYLNKKNSDLKFRYVRDYDLTEVIKIISEYDNEWLEDISRQTGSKHHFRTMSYHIYWYPLQWCPGDEYVPDFICNDMNLWKYLEPIVKDLEMLYDGKVGRATIVNLPAGKLVTPHADDFVYPNVIHRVHIPIITSDGVFFNVDDDTKNLKVGEAWEVNNAKIHGSYNMGDTPRVHFMVDIIPNSLIGTNKVIGPEG